MYYEFNRDFNYVKCSCERDCPNRSPDCHPTCEKYAEYLERLKEFNHKKRLEDERYAVSETMIKWIDSKRKRDRRKRKDSTKY